jgi:hypothetical protein
MNHFAKLCDGLVNDSKTPRERLKRAAIDLMRKFRVQHVERNCFRHRLGGWCENEFGLGIDKFGDQPR